MCAWSSIALSYDRNRPQRAGARARQCYNVALVIIRARAPPAYNDLEGMLKEKQTSEKGRAVPHFCINKQIQAECSTDDISSNQLADDGMQLAPIRENLEEACQALCHNQATSSQLRDLQKHIQSGLRLIKCCLLVGDDWSH
ncbi:unnamed protein product [Pleuronectes platessa]|uniref:Uncharacterized protein n=1 Tax=Pleuronectes platessa TaxID=8262 RepID=A0A9N7U300_PLEPL|nr:unnamed protein product [Pleuronectes platessa]